MAETMDAEQVREYRENKLGSIFYVFIVIAVLGDLYDVASAMVQNDFGVGLIVDLIPVLILMLSGFGPMLLTKTAQFFLVGPAVMVFFIFAGIGAFRWYDLGLQVTTDHVKPIILIALSLMSAFAIIRSSVKIIRSRYAMRDTTHATLKILRNAAEKIDKKINYFVTNKPLSGFFLFVLVFVSLLGLAYFNSNFAFSFYRVSNDCEKICQQKAETKND